MGKERVKATEEQFEHQKHIHKNGQADDLKIGQALMSPGPYWYNGYDDSLNGDLLAAEIIDDLGLTRKRTGIYTEDGQRMTDQQLTETIIDKIMPYFPEKAANFARFNVLPALLLIMSV